MFSNHISQYRQLLVYQALTPRLIKSSLEFLVVISSVLFVIISLANGIDIKIVTTELVTIFFATYKIFPAISTLTSLHQSIGASSEIINQYSLYLLAKDCNAYVYNSYFRAFSDDIVLNVDNLISPTFSTKIQPLSFLSS